MKGSWAAASVLPLLAAGVFVVYSSLTRPTDAFIGGDHAGAFDVSTLPGPDRAADLPAADLSKPFAASEQAGPALTPPVGEMRDALAPAPARAAAAASAPVQRPAPAARPATAARPTPALSAGGEAWASGTGAWAALLGAPASYIVRRSVLGSPRDLRSFLADAKAVDAYLDSPLVRAVLRSPRLTKALLGNAGVVQAVLASRAFQDPAAVEELLSSPMLRKMMDCPAVKDALADPDILERSLADAKMLSWMASNPRSLQALSTAAPHLARSLGAFR